MIALSGSGRSPNILAALREAKARKIATFAILVEFNRGSMPAAEIADESILFGKDMQAAEEKQIHLTHNVMRWLKSS